MNSFEPIGFFKCVQSSPTDSPRQGSLAPGSKGVIELSENIGVETLIDLVSFSHIWIIYNFHKNETWKPKVRPPRGADKKRSVFSTRSPYRPNPIGMSCVTLDRVEGRSLFFSEHDLLDGTPIWISSPIFRILTSIRMSG